MKSSTHPIGIFIILLLSLFWVQCDPANEEEVEPVNPDAQTINDYFSALPDWDNTAPVAKDPEVIDPSNTLYYDPSGANLGNTPYKCPVVEQNLVTSEQNIMIVGTNQGKIWPGAFIEGNSLESGDLKLIDIDRAPITISSDLPISNSSAVVDNPNSVTVQDAINEFMIAAGELKEGSKAGAGIMNFRVNEASSFHQSMISLGFTAGFTEPESQVGLEASSNVHIDRAISTHTVAARFVQEKFTVRLADDLIPNTSDFFTKDVNREDIDNLEKGGKLGADNIPLYIESVTYGRILVFTTTSTRVQTADSLVAALHASMDKYVNAGTEIDKAYQDIIDNSTTEIYSAGGTEEGANAVIAGLDWGEFFVAAPVSTTVPISMTVRTLGGRQIVKLHDSAIFQVRENCQSPRSYDITVSLEGATLESGVCLDCKYTSRLRESAEFVTTPFAAGQILGIWNGGSASHDYKMLGMDNTSIFNLISGYCNSWGISGYCAIQDYINKDERTYAWPYENLVSGNTYIEFVMNKTLTSIRFKYKIRKTPNY